MRTRAFSERTTSPLCHKGGIDLQGQYKKSSRDPREIGLVEGWPHRIQGKLETKQRDFCLVSSPVWAGDRAGTSMRVIHRSTCVVSCFSRFEASIGFRAPARAENSGNVAVL